MIASGGTRPARTDSRGRFELGGLQAGKLALEARRLGYASRRMEIEVGAQAESTLVEIVLLAVPEELERVEVIAASSPQGKLRGFYIRRQQRGTFGRFLEEDEIRRINPRIASDLFRSVPGVRLANNQNGGNAIRIRGCQPMVWVDDQRVPGAELDDLIVPSDIAAIEFYPSSAGIPAQYLERGNRLCGLILVWTRTG
jgi:Carboxypeptidase regulatory-like domain/TonB-dependent Receptor Plug Domain